MKSKNIGYVPALDHVRALAALLVVFHHVHQRVGARLLSGSSSENYWTEVASPFDAFIVEGHTGVALFMVLSGFIFTHIAGDRHVRAAPFLVNRVLRIYPLMIFVFLLGTLARPDLASPLDLPRVLLIPFTLWHPVDLWFVPNIYPFTTLFWAIAVEFKFYLLFPLLIGLLQRDGIRALVVIIVAMVALRILLVYNGANPNDIAYWTIFGRMDQFLIGMICAAFYRSWDGRHALPMCIFALALMSLLLFGYNQATAQSWPDGWKILWTTAEGAGWGLFIASYLHVAPRLSKFLARFLAWVGEISFSIYLLHLVVIALLLQVGPFPLGFTPGVDAFLNGFFFVLPLTLLAATVTFHVVEQPFLRYRVRYLEVYSYRAITGSRGEAPIAMQAHADPERG
ncbi:acyltransferase family protein [Microvirga massiliensis]|uniref:acyltransferase family protein n=1 Tax=Microvirga massiliensis TaxID=1033741 RepID=UPI00062B5012|nr:acyltransferase [Microvirga massiliensis]